MKSARWRTAKMAKDDGHSMSQTSVLPKHHQVYLVLRQQIADGVWTADEPMPAEVQLADIFGVSRITIRKAMERSTSKAACNAVGAGEHLQG
ncbi:GntR family transcriptional regulator [Paracoccus gahaiensis]|uniref:GntR family transcriptional regulator n=2 Tax=Paracoccus gahaiensis TaxID=1706839 RepID=A0A4U0R4B3_9RHOB|nr:GntR family transcriptional regulator [Paracoccus gahaiensis]